MTLSEALEAAGRIVGSYPNGGANAGKTYLGSLASTLCAYPRQVALRCAPSANPLDPPQGVVTECEFLPTPASIIAWCERHTQSLREEAARDDRVSEQLRLREEWQNAEKSPALLDKCGAWLKRADPVAAELVGMTESELAAKTEQNRRADAAELGRRCAEIQREWGDKTPPTIAGLPVSKELADQFGGESNAQAASTQSCA